MLLWACCGDLREELCRNQDMLDFACGELRIRADPKRGVNGPRCFRRVQLAPIGLGFNERSRTSCRIHSVNAQ